MYLLGKHGEYVSSLKDALKYDDALDAKIYIDKHGMEKITCVRKVHFQQKAPNHHDR